MAKLNIECEDSSLPFSLQKVAEAAVKVLKLRVNTYLELILLPKEEMQALNKTERSVDSVTDVLSFPMLNIKPGEKLLRKSFPLDYEQEKKAIFLGSIIICVERAKEQAAEYGHSQARELCYLLTHGILHLFGFDHMTDEDKRLMREKEEEIITISEVSL